ncbi:LytR C-terminal domain-containing protein [Microbacterium sp. p3-SID336]|uniref:LytR C-terminal domain-containing protein n=1 Tax=Microbacterium sp. p3-SID336 TaxID=2916212 RepID=UPI0021A809D5|nr:LytR C-terminal domain-containing protein [Microbacterium sp. p3-SID336]MCT1479321.1 LytR C-terminal domain-containing protein [Microbacterium sp. p3-SID336]
MNGWVVLLWSFVAALVLIIAGIFGSLVVMGRIELFPAAAPSAAPTPEETGVVDPTYSVMILNATPDEGLDDQMRDTLINTGWPAGIVFASDSASDDFATTTVYYVNDEDELAAIGLAGVIGGAEVRQDDFYADLNDTGGKQLTVVIGLDRSASAPETPEDTPAP